MRTLINALLIALGMVVVSFAADSTYVPVFSADMQVMQVRRVAVVTTISDEDWMVQKEVELKERMIAAGAKGDEVELRNLIAQYRMLNK